MHRSRRGVRVVVADDAERRGHVETGLESDRQVGLPGRPAEVKIYDGNGDRLVGSVTPFPGFEGTPSVAMGDVNDDGWTDLFVGGANRLFVGGGDGFTEATSDVFEWDKSKYLKSVYGTERTDHPGAHHPTAHHPTAHDTSAADRAVHESGGVAGLRGCGGDPG